MLNGGTDSRGKERCLCGGLLCCPLVSFIFKGQDFQSSAVLKINSDERVCTNWMMSLQRFSSTDIVLVYLLTF